ncbi:MAG: zinc-dependent alcohol dehydrogenase [Anaerolineae bacterium]
MWAFRIYGPNDGRYEQVTDPIPTTDEAIVAIRAAAICGTDLEILQGTMFYYTNGLAHYPIIPGHEWSGEVLAVGSAVSYVCVGDRVVGECTVACGNCDYCRRGWYNQCPHRRETGILNLNGGFAEMMAFPASYLHKIRGITFAEASMVETTAIAVYAVQQAEVSPADRVAILGSGPVGLQALQVARAYGARRVVMIGGRESRRRLAAQLGAEVALAADDPNLADQVRSLTDGQGFDVIIEATGNPAVTDSLLTYIRPRGRVVMTGLFNSRKGQLDLDALVTNNITLRGSLGSPNVWDETIHLMEQGIVRAGPLITHCFSLADAAQAMQLLACRQPSLIKVVLTPQAI